jgi:2,5-furandicarboxylate decarboxylase 1
VLKLKKILSLRSFIEVLKEKNEILDVKREVNVKFELSAVLKKIELEKGKAAFFEKIKDHDIPVVGGLYGTLRRIGLGLGVDEKDLKNLILNVGGHVKPFKKIKNGPVKAIFEKVVNLKKYPIPTIHERDAGPYITADVTVSKSPTSGRYNTGIYRIFVAGKDELWLNATKGGNLDRFHLEAERLGKPLDVAVSIGVDPASMIAASLGRYIPEVDELSLAGGLIATPLDVVECETVDLLVPANAEIVFEGKMIPNTRIREGPFGEFPGYYGETSEGRIVKVTGIMHREQPIFEVILGGPSAEHLALTSLGHTIISKNKVLAALKKQFPNVVDLNSPWLEGIFFTLIIQIRKKTDEDPMKIFNILSEIEWREGLTTLNQHKVIVMVDEDVDIYNVKDVIWAISSRLRESKNINLIDSFKTTPFDPAKNKEGATARLCIDATKPLGEKEKFERTRIPNVDKIKLDEYVGLQ